MDISLWFISLLEGLTEFLPISSTAHLILLAKLSSVDLTDPFIKFYLLAIQFGALLAGVFFFGRRVLRDRTLLVNVFISFLPSAVLGFIFYTLFKHLLEGNLVIMASALALGGVILIYLERVFIPHKSTQEGFGKTAMTKTDALVVGLAQAVAIIPGVSRSGATIVAGVLRGIQKAVIIEYTFILALPTLGVAVLYDAFRSREVLSQLTSYSELVWGSITAFLSACLALYILKKFLTRISLSYFGWYRLALALIIFVTILA